MPGNDCNISEEFDQYEVPLQGAAAWRGAHTTLDRKALRIPVAARLASSLFRRI